MNKKQYIFALLSLLLVSFMPITFASAALVTCQQPPCTIQQFFDTVFCVFNFLVVDISIPLGILVLAIAGIMFATAGGDPTKIKRGKDLIKAAIIGIAISIFAWTIVGAIVGTFDSGLWEAVKGAFTGSVCK